MQAAKKNNSIIPAKPAYDKSIRPQKKTLRVVAYCRVGQASQMELDETLFIQTVERILANPDSKFRFKPINDLSSLDIKIDDYYTNKEAYIDASSKKEHLNHPRKTGIR